MLRGRVIGVSSRLVDVLVGAANPTSASKEPKTTNKTWPARIRGGGWDTDGGGAAVIAMIWTSLSTDFQSHLLVPVMEPCNFCLVGRVR